MGKHVFVEILGFSIKLVKRVATENSTLDFIFSSSQLISHNQKDNDTKIVYITFLN